ncbi:NeuD/PglB/VioB family sugar acetyltransferase [Schleiferiaceae bacterium]|nr:NeuD/PglB/VioB family sugar acetyltransferase [Schleiferiaceae bacterium]
MADTPYNKDVYILGAGGLGREIFGWIKISNNKMTAKGFIDDDLNALEQLDLQDFEILGDVSLNTLLKAQNIILAITNSDLKRKIYHWQQESNGFEIQNFIYPNVILGSSVKLGFGAVISPNVLISSHTSIGVGCFINCGSQIGHDVKIGNYVNIMASVNIGGEAEIGDDVFIGTGAVVLPRLKISNNVRIGAGAIVMRSIKKPGTYIGNPAKRVF